MSFVPWLRGFLEGIGDADLSEAQGKRIIAEIQANFGWDASGPSLLPESGRVGIGAVTKKPVSRDDVLRAATNGGKMALPAKGSKPARVHRDPDYVAGLPDVEPEY